MARSLVWALLVCLTVTLGALLVPTTSQASAATAPTKTTQQTSAITNVARKEKLLTLARQWDLAIPSGFNPLSSVFNTSADELLEEVQAYIGIPANGIWSPKTAYAIYPPTVAAAADFRRW